MAIRKKQLKSGVIAFYDGRKRLTEKQEKAHIKAEIKASKNLDYLSAEQKKYANKVKAGLARANKAGQTREKGGQFISGLVERASKRIKGFDGQKLAEDMGYKSVSEMLKKEPKMRDVISQLMFNTGMATWFSGENAIDVIADFTGVIIMDGKQVSKEVAQAAIRNMQISIKNKLQNMSDALRLNIFENKEIRFKLPPKEIVQEILSGGDSGDTLDYDSFDEFDEYYQVYGSTKNEN